MRRKLSIVLILLLSLTMGSLAQAQRVRATRPDGSAVWLNPDGPWTEAAEKKPGASALTAPRTKPVDATQTVTLLKNATLSFNPAKWRQSESTKPNRQSFVHVNGDGYALIIAERIQMDPDSLVAMALTNARALSPEAHFLLDEHRVVNGTEVRCLQIGFITQGIAFRYFGYYYAGPAGTIQVITYTSDGLFAEFTPDFEDFLNGLEVTK